MNSIPKDSVIYVDVVEMEPTKEGKEIPDLSDVTLDSLEHYVKEIVVYFLDEEVYGDESKDYKELKITGPLLTKFIEYLKDVYSEYDMRNLSMSDIDSYATLGEFLKWEFKLDAFPNYSTPYTKSWAAFSQIIDRRKSEVKESIQESVLYKNLQRFKRPQDLID